MLSVRIAKSMAFQRSKVLDSYSDTYPISYYEDFSLKGVAQMAHSRKHVWVYPHKRFIAYSSCSSLSFERKKEEHM
jgi:hypothetical protein